MYITKKYRTITQNISCVFERWGTQVLCIPDHVHMTFKKKFACVFFWNPLKEIISIKLLLSLSYELLPSSLWSPRLLSHSLAQDGKQALNAPLALESPIFGAPFKQEINFFLQLISYAKVIIRPAKEPKRKEKLFCPTA